MKRSVFISGGNQCTHSKQPTCHKSLTCELYPIKFYRVHLAMRGFKIHNFNDNWQFHIYIYIYICRSNYYVWEFNMFLHESILKIRDILHTCEKWCLFLIEFHCEVIQVKSFTTFIIVTTVTTNKSVHLIGHLPKGDNFTWSCLLSVVSHWRSPFYGRIQSD